MASFNKVILAGNLTRDPQLSYLPSGTPVCEFGLAMNRKWKAQDGQMREEVCFVDCRCFGRGGETINQYMRKGRPLLIEGHLRFEQWESKEGQKRSRLTVMVDQFQFIDGPRSNDDSAPRAESGGSRPRGGYNRGAPAAPAGGAADMDVEPPMDDGGGGEIPF